MSLFLSTKWIASFVLEIGSYGVLKICILGGLVAPQDAQQWENGLPKRYFWDENFGLHVSFRL